MTRARPSSSATLMATLVAVVLCSTGSGEHAFAKASLAAQQAAEPKTGDLHKSYEFVQTGEAIPYRLYVPKSYNGTSPYPLVVALHGGGQDPDYVMDDTQIIRLAEKHHMIVVAPLGYNRFGGYGGSFPIVTTREAMAFAKAILVPAAKAAAERGAGEAPPSENIGKMEDLEPAAIDDSVEMASSFLHQPTTLDLSEQDVLNVVKIVERDYRVDPDRVYLTGNSMGGMGTQHLAAKYPEMWAAIAPAGLPIAVWSYPFWRLRDNNIAVIYVHGAADNLSNPYWQGELCKRAIKEGVEASVRVIARGTHVGAWDTALPAIFDFFANQRRGDGVAPINPSSCLVGPSNEY